jgi:hypothetical protein
MMVTFSWSPKPHDRDAAIDRFLKKGGEVPPRVQAAGRWTRADARGGFALIECEDAKALTEFAVAWHGILGLEVAPVVDDTDLREVFQRFAKQ